jgi:hypothetical protein
MHLAGCMQAMSVIAAAATVWTARVHVVCGAADMCSWTPVSDWCCCCCRGPALLLHIPIPCCFCCRAVRTWVSPKDHLLSGAKVMEGLGPRASLAASYAAAAAAHDKSRALLTGERQQQRQLPTLRASPMSRQLLRLLLLLFGCCCNCCFPEMFVNG